VLEKEGVVHFFEVTVRMMGMVRAVDCLPNRLLLSALTVLAALFFS